MRFREKIDTLSHYDVMDANNTNNNKKKLRYSDYTESANVVRQEDKME